jgi:predicted nucleotidyltransferase
MEADVDRLVARVRRALEPIAGVRVAYLFGSQVTGRARPDSDLDLAVLYEPSLDAEGREEVRRDVVAALVRELGPLGEAGDVVDLDRVGSGVGFRAVRDGRLLLERERAERVHLVVRIARAYDDDAPRRELMRRAAIEAGRRLGAEAAGRS